MRILIIKPSSLGDVVTTLPLLCDLFRAHPEAQIDWLIQPGLRALIENHDAVHRLIEFDRKKLAAWWWKPSVFAALRRLLAELRNGEGGGGRYDAVIDAQGLLRSAIFARATGAGTRIGFAHAREGAPAFYTHQVSLPDRGAKLLAVDRMRALGQVLGTKPDHPTEFRVPIQPRGEQQADGLLGAAGFDRGSFIAVLPGARWETKRWPMDRYAEITRRLLDTGERVVLLGAADEKPLCDAILQKIKNQKSKIENVLNLAGRTDVAAVTAILTRSAWAIGNDSGPLHLAAALGKPVVAIYGPTSPEFVGPFGQLQSVLRHDVPCHPCRRRHCGHHSCMNGLPVELVWEKAKANTAEAGLQNQPKISEAAANP